jgi:hypothetical protein
MQLYSSDVLAVMAENDLRLVVEHAAPRGRLKKEVVTLRAADGKSIELTAPVFSGVYYSSNLPIPHSFLDDYRRAWLVRIDKEEEERTIYVLTEDGRTKGLAQSQANRLSPT